MKTLSLWARRNKNASRLIIIVSWIILNMLGIFLGIMLKDTGLNIGTEYFYAALLISAIVLLIYSSFERLIRKSYFRRKSFDLLIAAAGFFMPVCISNNPNVINSPAYRAEALPTTDHLRDSMFRHPLLTNFAAELRDQHHAGTREKIRLIKQQIRKIKKEPGLSKTDQSVLITLSILIALFLLAGIAGLSCGLICSGSDALALVLLFGGSFLVIFFLIRIIRSIRIRSKAKESPVSQK